jgi:hypothetical protein
VHLDVATGQTRTIATRVDEETAFVCATPSTAFLQIDKGRRQAGHLAIQLDAYDVRSGQRRTLSGQFDDVRCTSRWLALQARNAIEVRDLTHADAKGRVFEIAGTIRGFAIADRWLAIIETTNDVTAIDLATGRRTRAAFGAIDNLVIDNRGRIATVHDGVVSLRASASAVPRAMTDKLQILSIASHDDGIVVFAADHSVAVIDHADHVARYAWGDQSSLAAGHQLAIAIDSRLALLDLRDGSMVQFPWLVRNLAISADGRAIAVTREFAPTAIVRLQVSTDVRGWLHQITNARLAPGSTVLTWPVVK